MKRIKEIRIEDEQIEEIAAFAIEKLHLQRAPDALELLSIAIKGAAALVGAKYNFSLNQPRAAWEALTVSRACYLAIDKELSRGEEAVGKGGAPS